MWYLIVSPLLKWYEFKNTKLTKVTTHLLLTQSKIWYLRCKKYDKIGKKIEVSDPLGLHLPYLGMHFLKGSSEFFFLSDYDDDDGWGMYLVSTTAP